MFNTTFQILMIGKGKMQGVDGTEICGANFSRDLERTAAVAGDSFK